MTYDECRDQFTPVDPATHEQLQTACQQNMWLMIGGIDFEDDPCMEAEYDYGFITTESSRALKAFFEHGNWCIRSGVVYKGLAFINQINGGDEWWTLKNFGGRWVAFESITFRLIIKDGEFDETLKKLMNATLNDNGTVSWY